MIDIHCHILPDFDDGARDLQESLDMVRLAVDSGVHGIVATPHFRGETAALASLPPLITKCQQLSNAIRQEGLPLRLYPGAEILCLPQTPELAREGKLPTLGDSRYLLTEFFFNETTAYIDKMLSELTDAGYRPVVAHPERYDAVQRNPGILEAWFRKGYVIQLNKGSILGAFGSRPEQTADIALRHGLAHIIASDAHSCVRRTTSMHRLLLRLEHKCRPEYTRILLEKNPERIIRNMDMEPIL